MEAADPRSSSDGAPASRGGFPGGESSSDRDGGRAGGSGGEGERERASFECNICLDTARDAVISLCGHLFWYRVIVIFICIFICILYTQLAWC